MLGRGKAEKGKWILQIPSLLKQAFVLLLRNDPLRMAGATAFFTTFALPALLIILIQVLGLIYNPEKVSTGLFSNIEHVVGAEAVQQIENTLAGFQDLASNWFITVGGFIFLIFVSTTLFKVIKDSLNQLWEIRMTSKRKIDFSLRTRLRSIIVILFTGLLFMAGLFIESVQAYIGNSINEMLPGLIPALAPSFKILISLIISTGWFLILFRFLPDAKPSWRVVFVGGFVTSILYNAGKFILGMLLSYSNLNTIFGTSASIMLLLLFVFYSSLILYFGAAFTQVWSNYIHDKIPVRRSATHYKMSEVEEE